MSAGRTAFGVVIVASVACGGSSEIAPPVAPPGASGTLLVGVEDGERCDWGWLSLPAATVTSIAKGSCSPPFLTTSDCTVLLAGDTAIDLATGAVTTLPALPTGDGTLELGLGGAPIVVAAAGYGEETWEEGPSWEHYTHTAWKLEGGAWVVAGAYDDGEEEPDHGAYDAASRTDSKWLLADEGPSCAEDAAAFGDAITAAIEGGGDADRWCVDRAPAPRLAWGVLDGEGGAVSVGPVMLLTGGAWAAAPGLGEAASARALSGDLLVVDDGGETVVYDLQARAVVFRASQAFFMPRAPR